METVCFTSPIIWGLSVLLLCLLCYAAVELIRTLIRIRIMMTRFERLSDIGRFLDWFRKKR